MWDTIITVVFIMLGLGSLFGLTLAIASKKFFVKVDPRTGEIQDILPGANCGACGFTGCSKYAEAVAEKSTNVNLCSPGGEDTAGAIAGIMGIEAEKKDRKIAVLMCSAKNVKNIVEYNGPQNCVSANLVQGGPKGCEYGCIGFGDCKEVCQFGAITMDKNGLPHVDQDKCTACGECVKICPKGLFQILPIKKRVHVRCKNMDKGKMAKEKCGNPCIGCKKCEKACQFDAIHVVNNLATIDYSKCTSCGKCALVCPTKIIRNYKYGQGSDVIVRLQEKAKAAPKGSEPRPEDSGREKEKAKELAAKSEKKPEIAREVRQ